MVDRLHANAIPNDELEWMQRTHEAEKPFAFIDKLPLIPFCFLGIGVYRAWIEIVFVGSFVSVPARAADTRDLFDLFMIITLIVCAIAAKKIGTFFNKPALYATCGVLLVVSTVCMFLSAYIPNCAADLSVPSFICGGIGIALIILFWSELYGCLNPLRVALYYSLSLIVGALIIYICRGFLFSWLFAATALLPLLSLALLVLSYRRLSIAELPRVSTRTATVPWKAVLLMALYAFAYGMKESVLYSGAFGPHSAPGTVLVSAIIVACVLVQRRNFDFAIIYRIGLPFLVVAFLLLPSFGIFSEGISNTCMNASYTAYSILIMLIIANMCYRFGVSAIWLFGIERAVRATFMYLGRETSDIIAVQNPLGANTDLFVAVIMVIVVVAGTMLLLSEKELTSRWGMVLQESSVETEAARIVRNRQLMVDRCSEIAQRYDLTTREAEVLLLLAQHKTVNSIERELFIANGTAKSHVSHIYQKTGVHTRKELFGLLGLEED